MKTKDVETDPAAGSEIDGQVEVRELRRNFNFWSLCGVGLMTGSTWPSLGGSIAVVIYNGGAPGAIYELIAVSCFYWMIAACIAELSSAIPSSAGVYHFAFVASGPKHGRAASWFAGYFNGLAWTFGAASVSSVVANQILALYQLFHPSYEEQRWHLFIIYLGFIWISCTIVLFGNRILPIMGDLGASLIIIGFLIIVITCAAMPNRAGAGYADSSFVWSDWVNLTGYSSDAFVFMMGMLNAAYAVGTPDVVTHLAEEIPEPQKNIPKAIGIQMVIGFVTAFIFLITTFYAVHEPSDLFSPTSSLFPMVDVFIQATGTKAGALGLVIVMIAPALFMSVGGFLTASRIVYTMARDHGTPFSATMAQIHPRWENPFAATLCCAILSTLMGFIYLGSSTAFYAFVGCFVNLTILSYFGAIFPYLITGRKYVTRGWFRMPNYLFVPLATLSCLYVVTFFVIFCFPPALPVDAVNMNYTSVMIAGLSALMGIYWFLKARYQYKGPDDELLQRLTGGNVHVHAAPEEAIFSDGKAEGEHSSA
ncbi:unnamed protein product [Clonostachys byssicola]|uniref:Choline transport protein n=1 Tax=Clonostachys byssicola TaxID=160290 RepID=A0A9N9U6B6_9HYPO|nr:unnamed protein product [Clonostachys byssicola]